MNSSDVLSLCQAPGSQPFTETSVSPYAWKYVTSRPTPRRRRSSSERPSGTAARHDQMRTASGSRPASSAPRRTASIELVVACSLKKVCMTTKSQSSPASAIVFGPTATSPSGGPPSSRPCRLCSTGHEPAGPSCSST